MNLVNVLSSKVVFSNKQIQSGLKFYELILLFFTKCFKVKTENCFAKW